MAGLEDDIFDIFVMILLIFGIALLSTLLGKPLRCPPLLLYLIFGCLFGNLGIIDPENRSLVFFAQFSITVLFYALGFEDSVEHFIEGLKLTWGITVINDTILFGAGYAAAIILFRDFGWTVHITCALACVAKPVSLTMLLLRSSKLLKTRAAIAIMSTAILDDVACLILLAIMLPIIIAAAPTSASSSTITTISDNVSAHFGINSTGFASVDTNVQSQVDSAKFVIASDLANVLNMSTSSIVFSTAVFASNYAEIAFYNLVPRSEQDDFKKSMFNLSVSDVSSSDVSKNWLYLTNRLYGTMTDYTLYSSKHEIVNVETVVEEDGGDSEEKGLNAAKIGGIIGKVIGFFAMIWVLHNWILPDHITEEESYIGSKIPLLRTFGIRHLLSFNEGAQVPLIVIVYGFAISVVAVTLGMPPIIGAWFSGLLLEQKYFDVIVPGCDKCVDGEESPGDKKDANKKIETSEEVTSSADQEGNNNIEQQKEDPGTTTTSEKHSPCTKTNVRSRNKGEDSEEVNRKKLMDNFLDEEVEVEKDAIKKEQKDGEYDRIMKERKEKGLHLVADDNDENNISSGDLASPGPSELNNTYRNNKSITFNYQNAVSEYLSQYPETPNESIDENEYDEDSENDVSYKADNNKTKNNSKSSTTCSSCSCPSTCPNTFERARDAVATAAFMWLGPVFFIHLGSTFIIKPEFLKTAFPQGLLIWAFLYISQVASSTLAGRWVGGFRWAESLLVGFGMVGRAELFFVVLGSAKSAGVIDNEVFVPMSIAALLMNVSLTLSLSIFAPIYKKYEYWEPGAEKDTNDDEDAAKDDDKVSTIISRQQSFYRSGSTINGTKTNTIDEHEDEVQTTSSRMSRESRLSRISHIVRRGVGMQGFVDDRQGNYTALPAEARDKLNKNRRPSVRKMRSRSDLLKRFEQGRGSGSPASKLPNNTTGDGRDGSLVLSPEVSISRGQNDGRRRSGSISRSKSIRSGSSRNVNNKASSATVVDIPVDSGHRQMDDDAENDESNKNNDENASQEDEEMMVREHSGIDSRFHADTAATSKSVLESHFKKQHSSSAKPEHKNDNVKSSNHEPIS